MDTYKSTVYVLLDGDKITDINSGDFLSDTTGWTAIDHGAGDKYKHAYRHYLPGRPCDEDGVSLYKLLGGQAVERTPEEIAADRAVLPAQMPTQEDRLSALEGAMLSMMGVNIDV